MRRDYRSSANVPPSVPEGEVMPPQPYGRRSQDQSFVSKHMACTNSAKKIAKYKTFLLTEIYIMKRIFLILMIYIQSNIKVRIKSSFAKYE